jgi:hypothetical protein
MYGSNNIFDNIDFFPLPPLFNDIPMLSFNCCEDACTFGKIRSGCFPIMPFISLGIRCDAPLNFQSYRMAPDGSLLCRPHWEKQSLVFYALKFLFVDF